MLPGDSVAEGGWTRWVREREKNLAISSSVDTVDPWRLSPRLELDDLPVAPEVRFDRPNASHRQTLRFARRPLLRQPRLHAI